MKGRILLVDDEIALAEVLGDRLQFSGYEVRCVENGLEALKILETESIDLILMDYMMPVMDGVETTKAVRSRDAWKKIPVVFLTARSRPEDRQRALEAGASDYLVKPFEVDTLMKTIEKWIG